MKLGIIRLYCGESGNKGYYNMQEVGLAKALEKRGIYTDIFILEKRREISIDKISDFIRIIYMPALKIINHGIISPKFILDFHIDVVHLLADNQIWAPRFIKFCQNKNIPIYCYIGTIRSSSSNTIINNLMKIIEKRNIGVYKNVKVIAKTNAIKEVLNKQNINNVKVIPVGLDLSIIPDNNLNIEEIKKCYNLPTNKKILIFVGRMEEYKKPMELINIFNYLIKRDDTYHLLIIGDGSLREKIIDKINRLGINKNITIINKIENKNIHGLYRCSDAFLNMNDSEIFGMSILEAMYQGCPVIAVKSPGASQIINNGMDGIILNDYDCDKWYKAIKEVSNNKVIRIKAKEKIINTFNWDVIADSFVNIINDITYSNGKKTVLLVHNHYKQYGGEDTVVKNEREMLEKNGHRVILYTRNNDEIDNFNFIEKVKFPFQCIYSFKTKKEIEKIITSNNIDIVHVHNTLPLISPSIYSVCKKHNLKIVQTLHNYRLVCPAATLVRGNNICEDCINKGLSCAIKNKCYRNSRIQTIILVLMLKVNRLLGSYKKVDYYIALTNFNKEKMSVLLNEEKIKVKPNFISNPKCDVVDIKKREYFTFLGRLNKLKGVEVLLRAWKEIEDKQLIIIGTGDEEEWCKNYIKDNNMQNVKMVGFKEKKEVMTILAKSKALIIPSQCYEGFPMTSIEAMSLGIPLIVSNIGNLNDIVTENNIGETFNYRSKDDLVKVINNFDLKKQIEYSKFALQAFNEKYNDEVNYNELMEIYNY